jgi:Na+-translocating ferredoxin:NAD+ oxidoreductase RnfG subunit
LISALILIALKITVVSIKPSVEIDEKVYLPVVFPDAVSFSEKKLTPKVYEAYDSYDEVIGYAFNTYDIAPGVRGYAGPIKLFTGLKKNGDLTAISVLSHNETRIYMQKLTDDKFYGQFSFKKVTDGFIIDKDLDGVTHATVSAEAIAKSVKKSAVTVANSHLKMNIPVKAEEGITKKELINTIVLLIITILSVLIFLKKRSNTFTTMKERGALITGYRDIILIVVLAYVGFFRSSPISITNVINIFYLRFPDFTSIFFYTLIGGFFIVTLLFGRVYCGYLCPFSALIELLEKIKIKKIKTYDIDLTVIKYIVLWSILTLVLYFDKVEISSFEPYLALFSTNRNVFMWSALIVVLLFTLAHKRIWCRYFCALGAFTAIVTKVSPYKNTPPEVCDSCGACNAVCPVEIDFKNIDNFPSEECIACRKCHEYCIKK